MEKVLHTIFLRSPTNLFDEFMKECQSWYDQPAHSFVEMRTRDNKKIRGDIFEEFCVLYLKHVRNLKNVWRLPDVPEDVLTRLCLKRRDMGIDIVAESDGYYYAIQCKYKKHTTYTKPIVSWKALSTFYALCMRTGPWEKYIVMTNCEYVRHAGKKTPKDISICLKTLRNITKEQWVQMCELESHTISQPTMTLSPDELRAARLKKFQTACKTPSNSTASPEEECCLQQDPQSDQTASDR
jgi:predicted helicase